MSVRAGRSERRLRAGARCGRGCARQRHNPSSGGQCGTAPLIQRTRGQRAPSEQSPYPSSRFQVSRHRCEIRNPRRYVVISACKRQPPEEALYSCECEPIHPESKPLSNAGAAHWHGSWMSRKRCPRPHDNRLRRAISSKR
jgi:hypothetical protein